MTNPWDDFHARWQGLRPPLRPDSDVVGAIGAAIAGSDDHVLLLGATPELSHFGNRLIAIDWCAATISAIWPGDDAHRRIVRTDWRQMPLADRSIGAAIGDGSPVALSGNGDLARLFDRLAAVLRPGGRVAIRCYVAPAFRETLADIAADTMTGRAGGFHALKWRLAMALADPVVAVRAIHRAFEELFPDRVVLGEATGWDVVQIAEIDAYAASAALFTFPTEAQFRAAIPPAFTNIRFAPAGAYPLAERCPILMMERRG